MKDLVDRNEKLAWMASDSLRRDLSLPHIKSYLIALLFLRFLDALSEHRRAHAGLSESTGDMWRALKVSPRIKFHSLVTSKNPREHIRDILNELEQQNAEILGEIFAGLMFDWEFISGDTLDHSLASALNLVQQMNLLPDPGDSSVVTATFERILDRFAAAEGKRGSFDTPADLAHLIAELVSPAPGESIYDPSCRSGSLLASVVMHARRPRLIVGQARSLQDWSTCRIRMIMQGAMDADIRCGDVLSVASESGDKQKFDVVISNPPFGYVDGSSKELASDSFARSNLGQLRGARSESIFLLHMIESANEHTGRVGALLPAGALFRGGGEGLIRRRLIEENLLDCVVSLPANLFHGTSIPVVLLVLRRNRKDEAITFIDASQGFVPGRSRSRLGKEYTEEIVKALRSTRSIEGYSYKASAEEVQLHDFNLSPGLFVKSSMDDERPANIQALEDEVLDMERKLSSVRQELNSCLEELKRL